MFWAWFLKYSSFFITAGLSLLVGLLLYRITTRRAQLIYYVSQVQWVILPQQQNQPQIAPLGNFTLFLWNQGTAPAREVHVGHFFLPAHNVYPDIPRDEVNTPGGGVAIRFPAVPPKTLVSISYLFFGTFPIDQIISYIGSEDGPGQHIPVMLQRVWPKWYLTIIALLLLAGLWVAVNALLSLIAFLWSTFYLQ